MKRYLLFMYWEYHPAGGWSDFVDSFDTVEEAREAARNHNAEFGDIVDKETGSHWDV